MQTLPTKRACALAGSLFGLKSALQTTQRRAAVQLASSLELGACRTGYRYRRD
jgi:hypothetical protein